MERLKEISNIEDGFAVHPVVALLGPRQSGKTTLARDYWRLKSGRTLPDTAYFDLEDPTHESRLTQAPKQALAALTGLVVIDEIQRAPDLFKYLRVLVDRPDNQARFLILGSASRELIRQSAETLAGLICYRELMPFRLAELTPSDGERLWYRGGFPRSFLADSDAHSTQWREAFIRTYLEQDIPALGIQIPAANLRRFWQMLTHYHGQTLNASDFGRSLGVSDSTVRRYLDILSGTFMVRQLQPWHANISKRQVKSPKIYFRDSGLFHRLLSLGPDQNILLHPKLCASWEGFALEQVIHAMHVDPEDAYFWAVHAQAELDLMLLKDGKRLGFEFKYGDVPTVTRSMRSAIATLDLAELTVVYPGDTVFALDDKIVARPLADICATRAGAL